MLWTLPLRFEKIGDRYGSCRVSDKVRSP